MDQSINLISYAINQSIKQIECWHDHRDLLGVDAQCLVNKMKQSLLTKCQILFSTLMHVYVLAILPVSFVETTLVLTGPR